MKSLRYYIDYREQDDRFIKQIEKILKKNISNCDFTVDDFCDLVFMSRSCLHRNLKRVTGFSATELLREYRIRVAADLLCNSSRSITEVSQKVGFYDYPYFSKCFKKIMEKSPREYIEMKKTQRINRILEYVISPSMSIAPA